MNKRIFSILLLLAFFVFSFSFTVLADESSFSGSNYVDVLDYIGRDGTLSNSFIINAGESISVPVNWGEQLGGVTFFGVEIILAYSGLTAPVVTSLTYGSNERSLDYVSRNPTSGMLRIRANVSGSTNAITARQITLSMTSSVYTSCNLLSFRLYLSPNESTQLPYSLNTESTTVSYNAGVTAFYNFSSSSLSLDTTYTISVLIDEWRNYDILQIQGRADCFSFSSVSVWMQNNVDGSMIALPFEYNYLDANSVDTNIHNYYQISIDLSQLDHVSLPDSTVWVRFDMTYNLKLPGIFYVFDLNGSVSVDNIDYSTRFLGQIMSMLSTVRSYTASLRDEVVDYFPKFLEILQSLGASADSVNKVEQSGQSAQDSADSLLGFGQNIENNTPKVDTNMQVSVGSIPADGSAGLVTNFFDLFWSNSIFLSMITTVAGIATISFVFFGKKE